MPKTVLLYQLSEVQKARLTRVCLLMKIRRIIVEPNQYGKSIGQLLGKETILPSLEEYARATKGQETIDQPMLVMQGFDNANLDVFLKGLRNSAVPPIALKAIVTPANISWTSLQLYRELQKEHLAFQKQSEKKHPS